MKKYKGNTGSHLGFIAFPGVMKKGIIINIIIWFVRLVALRPLLAYLCQPRVIVKIIVEKQMECRLAGKPKFPEKTCPSATFVHHKIPHDQTRV
jgi:hypothetical protein